MHRDRPGPGGRPRPEPREVPDTHPGAAGWQTSAFVGSQTRHTPTQAARPICGGTASPSRSLTPDWQGETRGGGGGVFAKRDESKVCQQGGVRSPPRLRRPADAKSGDVWGEKRLVFAPSPSFSP